MIWLVQLLVGVARQFVLAFKDFGCVCLSASDGADVSNPFGLYSILSAKKVHNKGLQVINVQEKD